MINKDFEVGAYRVLTKDNWTEWKKQLITHFSDKEHIGDLIEYGTESTFKVDKPERRIPVVKFGAMKTKESDQRDGFMIDEDGGYLIRSDLDLDTKLFLEESRTMKRNEEQYKKDKMLVIRYCASNINKDIADELDVLGELHKTVKKTGDVVNMLIDLEMVATGRGSQTIANDCESFLSVSVQGDTYEDYVNYRMSFRDKYIALMHGREPEEILRCMCNSRFVTNLIGFTELKAQVDLILGMDEYPDWATTALDMNRFLKVKKHMREKVRKNEKNQGGMIQANLANSEYSKQKNQSSLAERSKKMICFFCGELGHAASSCSSSVIPVCGICKLGHHTKAHDMVLEMKKKRSLKTGGRRSYEEREKRVSNFIKKKAEEANAMMSQIEADENTEL